MIAKRNIVVFFVAVAAATLGCFAVGGLAELAIYRATAGTAAPEMFGWFGLFILTGVNLSLICAPAILILAAFLAAQTTHIARAVALLPMCGALSLLALLIWHIMGLTPLMAVLAGTTCGIFALILGIVNRKRLQNKTVHTYS